MEGTANCPGKSRFIETGGEYYWVWGENSATIYLSAWDREQEDWTLPYPLSFGFEDPETGRPVQLDNLRAAFLEDQISIIGADPTYGEIWVLSGDLANLHFSLSQPSPWSAPQAISLSEVASYQIASVVDSKNIAHTIWGQGKTAPGTSLFYSRQGENQEFPAVEIVRGFSGEIVRQPDMLVDSLDRLNLVFSGGKTGEIYFTRAEADQAGSASGWTPPIQISASRNASWPQIAIDPGGRIFVLYAMPINEKRGVYLVYSDDSGDSWSTPALVFDAQENNWPMVDHPSLIIAPDGSLHASWVRSSLAAANQTDGIYYSRTRTAFEPIAVEPTDGSSYRGWGCHAGPTMDHTG